MEFRESTRLGKAVIGVVHLRSGAHRTQASDEMRGTRAFVMGVEGEGIAVWVHAARGRVGELGIVAAVHSPGKVFSSI